MKIIEQSHEILECPTLEMIEKAGRTCYKSEDKITGDSAEKFVKMLCDKGHHAMIEFGDIVVRFITNRGVTHELVRHRMCSFAQESTRYVKYDEEMEFIWPVWLSATEPHLGVWTVDDIDGDVTLNLGETEFMYSLSDAEGAYKELLRQGWRPEQAREVLPNSLKTEIVVKANIREWRHILKLRTGKPAHPQMRALMLPLLAELKDKIPVLFDDI